MQPGFAELPDVMAAEKIGTWLADTTDWRATGLLPSPLAGRDGNLEFLLGARRNG
jgi:23S rRNA (cytidine1920-2'-O)/16S rRNA (cytidine1409-2'-O)-methyltransferase